MPPDSRQLANQMVIDSKFLGVHRQSYACLTSHREMITTWNLNDMLKPLFRRWMENVNQGRFPEHVIIFRDGVSEGEFQHVLQQELRDIKAVWEDLDSSPKKELHPSIKYSVVIASKRHHIRFFPAGSQKDQSGNPLPGTLVERDVTSAREWDFYLCAHKAIQGTARPVHYQVIHDEMGMDPDWFIQFVYDQSYGYVRSSTPVSVIPAIYYAHLASRRAVAHERALESGRSHYSGELRERNILVREQLTAWQTGKILKKSAVARLKELTEMEYPPLLKMNDHIGITYTMWYI